jgi:hypothetical protein
MVATDKTRNYIAQSCIEPIVKRLSAIAREAVIESFCREHYGKCPEGRLCRPARRVQRDVLDVLMEVESRLN